MGITKIKNNFLIIYLIGLLLFPFFLGLLPKDYFNDGQSICLSVRFFNQRCYGCGMTRAIQHLIHFEFSTAYRLNKFSIIVLFVLFFLWLKAVRKVFFKLKQKDKNV